MEHLTEKDQLLYNSRLVDAYLKLIKNRYSYLNVGDLLEYAGLQECDVADKGHWISQEQMDRFYEKLVEMTGNAEISREAGRFATSPDGLGVMSQYVLGLIDPANAFVLMDKVAANFTRASSFETRKRSANEVEIVVSPREEMRESQFQCDNRKGLIEGIVLMFNRKLPQMQHPECMCKGDAHCRYVVTWDMPASVSLSRLRNWTNLILLAVNTALVVDSRLESLKIAFPVSVTMSLLLSMAVERSRKEDLRKSLDSARESTDRLIEQININYNNTLVTNEVGKALSTFTNTDDVLDNVIQILEKRLDYDRGLILLADPERTKLVLQAGFGYSDVEQQQFGKLSFHLDRPESKGVFVLSFRQQKPYLINNLDDIEDSLSPRSLALAKLIGTQSFICCPIVCEKTSVGILAVDNVKSKRPLLQSDLSLLMGIASVIALSIRNAELIDTRLRQFNSIMQVLAASIDARDSLTAGHSEKVTEYALGICNELGLPVDYREMIRVASLLHDYGKLAVPDAILKKNGKLTEEEYEIVKAHSQKSRDILGQIHFEGIYREVPEIAGAHHEKIDGSGYPMGLKGDEIPLGAKIIAVADYFEAITAKRHYREPMDVDTALALLREGVGTHFDEKVVAGLISYFTKTYLVQRRETVRSSAGTRSRRVPCRTSVSYRLNGKTLSASSEDISESGIYVVAQDEVRQGMRVALTIDLPDNPSKVKARGRVAWVNDNSARKKPTLPAGFGVELLEFWGGTEEVYRQFMNSYTPADYRVGNA